VIKASASIKAASVPAAPVVVSSSATTTGTDDTTEEEEEEEEDDDDNSHHHLNKRLSIPITHYPGEKVDSWKKYLLHDDRMSVPPIDAGSSSSSNWIDRRRRFVRSKTNPELVVTLSSSSSRVQELLMERSARGHVLLEKSTERRCGGAIEPQDSTETSEPDQPISRTSTTSTTDRRLRYRRKASNGITDRQQSLEPDLIVSTRGSSVAAVDDTTSSGAGGAPGKRFYRLVTQPKIDYMKKLKPKLVFGRKGGKDNELNWPRGVAVVPACDEVSVFNRFNW
jgi:hypothetical protein